MPPARLTRLNVNEREAINARAMASVVEVK